MISSTTDLLNEITSLTSFPSRLLARDGPISPPVQKQRKELALRYACMQSWFLRCSWVEKVSIIVQLLKELKCIESLSQILNSLLSTSSKTTIYTECQHHTNFVYDTKLNDHNRSLPTKYFAKTQNANIEWFSTLDEDYQRVSIIIGLIRLGGGSVMHSVFEKGRKLYEEKIANAETGKYSLVDVKPTKEDIEPRPSRCPSSSRPSKDARKDGHTIFRILNIKPDNIDDLMKKDLTNPLVKKVEEHRKEWDKMMRKYRIKVLGKPASPKAKAKDSGKGKTKGASKEKSPKSDKKAKSKTSEKSKSGKAGKKGQKITDEGMDWIQILPIWVIKKIFNYFDEKTLKQLKVVNKYWDYAIADLLNERKAKKFLDNFIKKMEEQTAVDSETVETIETIEKQVVVKEDFHCPEPRQRLKKLLMRGAAAPQLRVKILKPIKKTCLAMSAAAQQDDYVLPVQELQCFPRNWEKTEPSLYKSPPFVSESGSTRKNDDMPFSDSSSMSSEAGDTGK